MDTSAKRAPLGCGLIAGVGVVLLFVVLIALIVGGLISALRGAGPGPTDRTTDLSQRTVSPADRSVNVTDPLNGHDRLT